MVVLASIWCVIAVAARPAELKGSGYIETIPTHAVLHSVRALLPIDIMADLNKLLTHFQYCMACAHTLSWPLLQVSMKARPLFANSSDMPFFVLFRITR
jgi:hypothetical protein